jgi:alpha-L-rhamnosidase
MKKILILTFLLSNLCYTGHTQTDIQPAKWNAKWIVPPETDLSGFGVYLFRCSFNLIDLPKDFVIHVSADSRYRLFVNGAPVCFGPARGDLKNWNYESIDISGFLKKGNNCIAAQVFNWGKDKPVAQVTSKTAFILQGPEEFQNKINTGQTTWKVLNDSAFKQIKLEWWKWAHGWYAVGATDEFTASKHPWGWELPGYDDNKWPSSKTLLPADGIAWNLVPRTIPMLEEKVERIPSVCFSSGIEPDKSFLSGKSSLTIPSKTKAILILDNQKLTIGFPELRVSKGGKSIIKLTYAESPFTPDSIKPNRNEIKGNLILGCYDIFHPDGGTERLFRPLWFRTFRYVQMEITTLDEELIINDYYQKFTAYPFKQTASFESDDKSLIPVWDVSWHTARCCAFETYMDCPYYEQLNYEGDSRIQSLISLYMTGDDRLMRSSIEHFSHSRLPSGILQAAYPFMNKEPIIIPTYSLHFINMLHDYYMYRTDTSFLRQFLPDVESILNWYDSKMDRSGLLGALPEWNFVDWGYADLDDKIGKKGQSGIISLIYASALDDAADLFNLFSYNKKAEAFKQKSSNIKLAVNQLCYDDKRNIYSDTPDKKVFSEQMNSFAVLTDVLPVSRQKELMQKVLSDTSLIKCSAYFKFYLFRALKKAGLGDEFLPNITLWRNMLDAGLTTFSEMGNTAKDRSDCHAWSAHPGMEFISVIAGIAPASPGFSKVRIQPSFNNLNRIKASMPHPAGKIEVDLKKTGNVVKGTVTIPEKTGGEFIWNGRKVLLKPGKQIIDL